MADVEGSSSQVDERFAANLRTARERAGMSQAALAARMASLGFGFHQQTITRIESGTRPVRLAEAIALARVLDTSADALSRPSGLAQEAWLILDLVRTAREAHMAAGQEARRLADTRGRLERAIGRAERDGTADELADEISAARSALEDTAPGMCSEET